MPGPHSLLHRQLGRDVAYVLLEQGKQLVADADGFLAVGSLGEDEVGDAQVAVSDQGLGHVLRRPDEPGGAGATAAVLAGCGVEVLVEDLSALGQLEEALLADGPEPAAVAAALRLRHLRDLGFRVGPGLLGGVTDERGDAQAELERRVLATQLGLQATQPADAFGHAIQWLAPEELYVGIGRSHSLCGLRRATEVQAGMRSSVAYDGTRGDRGPGDGEVLTGERHILLGPQSPYQLEELLRPRVPLRLVALAVAVRREIVLARHDVDQQPPAAQLVECAGG